MSGITLKWGHLQSIKWECGIIISVYLPYKVMDSNFSFFDPSQVNNAYWFSATFLLDFLSSLLIQLKHLKCLKDVNDISLLSMFLPFQALLSPESINSSVTHYRSWKLLKALLVSLLNHHLAGFLDSFHLCQKVRNALGGRGIRNTVGSLQSACLFLRILIPKS